MTHWNEVTLDKWAFEWIEQTLLSTTFSLPALKEWGGDEDLRLTVLKADGGKSSVAALGEFQIAEFSSTDIEEPEIRLQCDMTCPAGQYQMKPLIEAMQEVVKKDGLQAVKTFLAKDFMAAIAARA